jgi:hypothetical protein
MRLFFKVILVFGIYLLIVGGAGEAKNRPTKSKPNPVSQPVVSSAKEIFNEEFFDNRNNWAETKSNEVAFKVANGYYALENKGKKGSYASCVTLDINADQDFLIEANIAKTDGSNDAGFGIVWGFQNANNYYVFKINGDGYYSCWKYNNDKVEASIDWTLASYIKKENTMNKVTLKKIKEKLQLFVNDHQLAEVPFEKFFGNNIGVSIDPKLKLQVDNLIVIQGSRILTLDGLKEDFFENSNNWYEGSDKEITAKVMTGQYLLEHKTDKTSYLIGHPLDLNPARDFKAETIINQTAGSANVPFHLIWGAKDADNFYFLGINGDGKYMVGKNNGGQRVAIIDWTPSPAINTKPVRNKLGLQKVGSRIKILINDNPVNEIAYEKFYGNLVGFELVGKGKYEIDNLVFGNR